MARLRNVIALLRAQLWIVPAIFVLGAIISAALLLTHGVGLNPEEDPWWLYGGKSGTAQVLLSGLLSGLMTITALVVSVTFVVLTLAANQLGPRLIPSFMSDRQIQSAIGLFIGTIIYLILVLRALDDGADSTAVPQLAITTGSALTVLCLLVLLFFVHKLARAIVADNVIEAVSQHLRGELCEVLPGEAADGAASLTISDRAWPVSLAKIGYVQVVDYARLVALACDADLRLRVCVRAGHYVLRNGRHVLVEAASAPDELLERRIRSAFTIGSERTPAQDPEHGITQLVEIATRALSPGVNDFFTALAAIDRLGATVEEIFSRSLQPEILCDDRGVPRIVANRSSLDGMLDAAFHPVRQSGASQPGILIRIAGVFADLAAAIRTTAQRRALLDQIERLAESASGASFAPRDRQDVFERIKVARQSVSGQHAGGPGNTMA